MDEYYAYIDEAGDEGFGKLRSPQQTGQSNWLALGGIVVSKENDAQVPSWRDEVVTLFPNRRARDLHFHKLNHDQRVAACSLIGGKSFGAVVVLSNKITILDSSKKQIFKEKGYLYNYLVRYLLERISLACKSKSATRQAKLTVTFSRRANTDYSSMSSYLRYQRDGRELIRPKRSICWDVFDPKDIFVENHEKRAGLQIADIVTSATYKALEPNRFGNYEPRYSMLLRPRYLKRGGTIMNCGITLVPPLRKCPLDKAQSEYIRNVC